MSEYFDKDFFKLSLGFIMIIAISVLAIFTAKVYEASEVVETEVSSDVVN